MFSLRKILFSVFCSVAGLLALVVLLGFMQYRFTRQYDTIIYQSERILFRYATLREHLTRSMLSEKWKDSDDAAAKIDALNSDLTRLLENTTVPDEYKLALINQVDLPGIALLAREIADNPKNKTKILQLHDQLRTLAENLMQFDRVLSGQMKTRLVRFQGIAIGALTLIIASVSLFIIFMYQRALMPLIEMSQHLKDPLQSDAFAVDPRSCREVVDLVDQVNIMIAEGRSSAADYGHGRGRYSFALQELNKLNNLLNGIINYAQLLIDEGEQYNDDEEHLEILKKVRDSGERMGLILQNKKGGKKVDDESNQ